MKIQQPVLDGVLYSFVRVMDDCTENGCLMTDINTGINRIYKSMDGLSFEECIAATLKVYGVEATLDCDTIGSIIVRPSEQYRDCGRKATLKLFYGEHFETEIDGILTLLGRPHISLPTLKRIVNHSY